MCSGKLGYPEARWWWSLDLQDFKAWQFAKGTWYNILWAIKSLIFYVKAGLLKFFESIQDILFNQKLYEHIFKTYFFYTLLKTLICQHNIVGITINK